MARAISTQPRDCPTRPSASSAASERPSGMAKLAPSTPTTSASIAAQSSEHIASSCRIEREDFADAQLAGKGGLQKAWTVFDGQLDELLVEMNEELVA